MPSGFERINAKKSLPNDHITFIKSLKGRDETIAQDFLERIAAQCVPIMREHHIYMTSLEEHEPNREFVGRNINAGEVIQLVLKSLTGQWLPFTYVQMVMMHELAHCKQMNHSKVFWDIRNKYADQMRGLWSRNYTGEGIWGRGKLLTSGEFENSQIFADNVLPEQLCGGAYRTGGIKRRPTTQLSYQEQKQRRILKKFGANGIVLGEDKEIKAELEKGKKTKGNPRVAGSKRGRELRAAAALARFDQEKKAEEALKEEVDNERNETGPGSGSEELSDYEDVGGPSIVDKEGRRLIKVCEGEDTADGDVQNEIRELVLASRTKFERLRSPRVVKSEAVEPSLHLVESKPATSQRKSSGMGGSSPIGSSSNGSIGVKFEVETKSVPHDCPICSFRNIPSSTICEACSHVLMPGKVRFWRCRSKACQGGKYMNPDDFGVCGVCGEQKGQQ